MRLWLIIAINPVERFAQDIHNPPRGKFWLDNPCLQVTSITIIFVTNDCSRNYLPAVSIIDYLFLDFSFLNVFRGSHERQSFFLTMAPLKANVLSNFDPFPSKIKGAENSFLS